MVSFQKIIDKLPSITPREKDKNIVKFTNAFSEEIDDFGVTIEDSIQSHFIDQASGEQLDIIGKQYSPIGDRNGRSDSEYRQYLKALVPAFRFKGTVPGIRATVAAGLDIESGLQTTESEQDVFVSELYEQDPDTIEEYTKYDIELYDWTPHRVRTVDELAELSDASVSRLRRIEYYLDIETTEITDSINIQESEIIDDTTTTSDTVDTRKNEILWDTSDWGELRWAEESNSRFEFTQLSQEESEQIGTADTITTDVVPVLWDTNNWGELHWN